MPKITSVEPQKSSKGRFNVYLDGKFAFGADEDLIVNQRLLIGKIIENQDLERLLFEAEVGKLMEGMYALFSIRQHSEKEIRDKLRMKNFKIKTSSEKEQISEIVIESLIQRLKDKSLIDDEQFAKGWVDARRKSKNKGKIALKSELISKGINKEIIEKVLGENIVNEEELARQAIEKKLKNWNKLEPQKFKQKIFGFLGRKGFDYDTILKTINQLKDRAV